MKDITTSDTYEATDSKSTLERYEWDDVWHEQTDASGKYRVFYIGDSISRGIRRRITALSGAEVLCSGYATSKGIDNPYLRDMIRLAVATEKYDAVLFNNGLHGWHLSEREYAEYYREIVRYLVCELKLPLKIVTTTATKDAHTDRAIKRNDEALKIAKELCVGVIDLYSESVRVSSHIKDDGVHFDDEGYDILARYILEKIK